MSDIDNKKAARIAGIWYLLFFLSAGISQIYLNKTFVLNNAIATAQHILATQSEFVLTFLSSLFGHVLCFLLLVLALYRLLKDVNGKQARLMLSLVLVSVSVMFVILIFQICSLFVLTRAEYFTALSKKQVYEIATLFLQMRFIGEYVVGIFWGLWLFPLAYLVYQSGFIPKFIAWLLVLSGIAHITDCVLYLTDINTHSLITSYLSIPVALGELAMMLWLLIKGVSKPKGNK